MFRKLSLAAVACLALAIPAAAHAAQTPRTVTALPGTSVEIRQPLGNVCDPWVPTGAELAKVKLAFSTDDASNKVPNSSLTGLTLPLAPMKNCIAIDLLQFQSYVSKASLPSAGHVITKKGVGAGNATFAVPFWGIAYMKTTVNHKVLDVYCAWGDKDHPIKGISFDTKKHKVDNQDLNGQPFATKGPKAGTSATLVGGGFKLPTGQAVMGFPANPDTDPLVPDTDPDDIDWCRNGATGIGSGHLAIKLPVKVAPVIKFH